MYVAAEEKILGERDVFQLGGSSVVTIALMRLKVTQQRMSLNGCNKPRPVGVHCAL